MGASRCSSMSTGRDSKIPPELIHLRLELTREEMTEEIRRTFRASGAGEVGEDVYVRYCVTRGEGPVDLFPDPGIGDPVCDCRQATAPHGGRISTVGACGWPSRRTRRNPINALNPNIKGGNYLNNVLGVIEARKLGADDCVMLNDAGLITESSNSNVFFAIDGNLVTPAETAGHLRGLTRVALQEACSAHGLDIVSRDIPLEDVVTRHGKLYHQRHAGSDAGSLSSDAAERRRGRISGGWRGSDAAGDMAFYKDYVERYLRNHLDQRLNK